jgi:hypothetical protein
MHSKRACRTKQCRQEIDALGAEAGKLDRASVFARLHVDAVAEEEGLKRAQDKQIEQDSYSTVEENVDEVPARLT